MSNCRDKPNNSSEKTEEMIKFQIFYFKRKKLRKFLRLSYPKIYC